MQYFSTLAIAISAIIALPGVYAAPVAPSLDAPILLKNGQEAQRLNSLFKTLNRTDACTTGDSACIDGSISQCVNSTWETARGKCAKSEQCFAIPSVREDGVLLACTNQGNALAVIKVSGATGGIFGNSTQTDSVPNATVTVTATATAAPTVTVTVFPSLFTSQTTVTTTLSPEQASSILSSIVAEESGTVSDQKASSTSSVIVRSSTAAASSSTRSASSLPASRSAPSSSFTTIPPAITIRLTAAPVSPSSSATAVASSATAETPGGGYGSGY